ncbi:MAG: hypothetical protein ACT4QG_05475 [Sporichthyaceae bacterium]
MALLGAVLVLGGCGTRLDAAELRATNEEVTLSQTSKDVNARGGLACHSVVLYQRDDGNDVSRSPSTPTGHVKLPDVAYSWRC